MAKDLGVPVSKESPFYFISYNSEDADRVAEYVREIHKTGIPVWYDCDIPYGEKWKKEIAKRISNCQAVIMFLTKGIFLKDESYVCIEFEIAKQFAGKKIYAVILDDIKNSEVPSDFWSWWVEVKLLQCVKSYEHTSPEECVKQLVKSFDSQAFVKNESRDSLTVKQTERIVYENGDVYVGETVNGLPHGMGTLTYANKNVYTGNFANGLPNGMGKFTWTDKTVYIGGFQNDKRHGKGTYRFSNGDVYEGGFANGNFHGKGKYTWANGEIKEGEFKDGIFVG